MLRMQKNNIKKTLAKITGALKCVGVRRYIIIHEPGGTLPH